MKAEQLSSDLIRQARTLRAEGMGWKPLARELGTTYFKIRRTLDRVFRAEMTAKGKKQWATYVRPQNIVKAIARPSNEVLEERNRAYYPEISLTAFLMGDPRPGRSALDRKLGSR